MKDELRREPIPLVSSLILHPSSLSDSDRPAGPWIIIYYTPPVPYNSLLQLWF